MSVRHQYSTAIVVLLSVVIMAVGAAQAQTDITFAYWGSTEEKAVVDKMVKAFEAEHPEYNVVQLTPAGYWDKLIVMLSSDSELDVFQNSFENVAQYAWNNLAVDLGPYIERDNFDMDLYVPSLVEALQYHDTQYFLPKDWTTFNIVYNETSFNGAGLAFPHEGWTKEEFLADAKKMTNPDKEEWGFGGLRDWSTFGWSPFILSAGAQVFSNDGTECRLDTPEAISALEWAISARYEHGVIPPPGVTMGSWNGFENGKIAMTDAGHWPIPRWIQQPNLHFNATGWFRMGEDLPVRNSLYSVGFGIAPNSKNKDAAWQLVKFLSGEEGQKIIAESGVALPSMPHLAELIPTKEVSMNYVKEASRGQSILRNVVEYFNSHRIFVEEFKAMTENTVSPRVAAQKACARVDALLAPFKNGK